MEYLQYSEEMAIVSFGSCNYVLNLIINGIPSIHISRHELTTAMHHLCFKPYYKWNTFNTNKLQQLALDSKQF